MKSPFFSIVIPNYGGEEYFAESTGSVLNQSFRDIELILVDDCSPGNIPALCDNLAKTDDRVKVVHRRANGGLSAARNSGADAAVGGYILFLDNDDYLQEGVLRKAYDRIAECMADNDAVPIDILQCDSILSVIQSNGKTIEYKRVSTDYPLKQPNENTAEYVLKRYTDKQLDPFIATRYIRTEFMKDIQLRCDSRYDSIEDFDFAMKAYLGAQRVEHCEVFNFVHACRDGSMSLAMSTKSCINRINVFTDWFNYVEGLDIDKTVKNAFLARMAKEISKIWGFAATGKNCRPDVDKELIWSIPENAEKYIRYIPIASPVPRNPLKWRSYLKKNKRAFIKWRRKRKLLKCGVRATYSLMDTGDADK